SRRAAGGAAGCAVGSPGIARRRRIETRVLRGYRLAKKDRSRLAPAAHAGGILAGDALVPQPRAGGRRAGADGRDITDTQRNAVQRPAMDPGLQLACQAFGISASAVAVHKDPGADFRFKLVNACQALFEEIERSAPALANVFRGSEQGRVHLRFSIFD